MNAFEIPPGVTVVSAYRTHNEVRNEHSVFVRLSDGTEHTFAGVAKDEARRWLCTLRAHKHEHPLAHAAFGQDV